DLTPREAYQRIVSNDVEPVPVDKIAKRTAANGVMPYPPGIPMLMSGENFGAEDSPQIGYLRGLETWDRLFPGFEHVTEGAEIIGGTDHLPLVRSSPRLDASSRRRVTWHFPGVRRALLA